MNKLIQIALKLRQDTFSAFIKKVTHLGGSFSMIEIIVCLCINYEKI